jgi:hypothetical protein
MAVIHWAKLYIIFQKKRQNPEEKRLDLIYNSIIAFLFTFATMDILFTLPEIAKLISILRNIKVN